MIFETDEQYYADTSHISNSMVSAYLRSPSYYEALYVSRTIVREPTPALIFGSAVDCCLTEGEEVFNQKYRKAFVRTIKLFKRTCLKKENAVKYDFESEKVAKVKREYDKETKLKAAHEKGDAIILTPAIYDSVLRVVKKVRSTDAFKWLETNGAVAQVSLTGTVNGGVKVKGKLDWLTIKGNTAYIDDLKTAKNILPMKFHYHCLDYGYYRQAWMYRNLVLQNYPDVQYVINRHIVATKDAWPQVNTFILDEERVLSCGETMCWAIDGIIRKDFDDPIVSWEKAVSIGGLDE